MLEIHMLKKFETFQTVQLLGNSYKEMAIDGETVSSTYEMNWKASVKS